MITVTTEKLYQFEVLHGVNMKNLLRCPLLRGFEQFYFFSVFSSAGSSTILRHTWKSHFVFLNRSCFCSQQHNVQRKGFCLSNSQSCLQRTLYSNAETLIPHYTAIIGFGMVNAHTHTHLHTHTHTCTHTHTHIHTHTHTCTHTHTHTHIHTHTHTHTHTQRWVTWKPAKR